MIITLILIILSALLPDLYIWHQFVRGHAIVWNILYWIPFAVFIILPLLEAIGIGSENMFKWVIGMFLLIVVPKLMFTLISICGKGIGLFAHGAVSVGNIVALGAAVAVMLLMGYGFIYGWKHVVVKHETLAVKDLPEAFEGYKIVQLSDLHIGTYGGNPEIVEKIVAMVNSLNPDLIVFTGDLVNSSPEELEPFIGILSEMHAKDGVYSVLGNHDYCEYRRYAAPDSPRRSLARLIRLERDMGWNVLLNDNHLITRGNNSIAIVGVENDGEPPFPSHADLPKALKGLYDDEYKILLSHNPVHWRRNVLPETNIQLMLAGHTHGLHMKIGNFSPAKWRYPEWGGLYEEAGRLLYVSLGAGSNVAFRLGAWPEINVLTLHSHK